jgi:hypothetical protein
MGGDVLVMLYLHGHFKGGARAPVSRFFEIPIQMIFSGLKNLLHKRSTREGPCTEVGGYMRKGMCL